MRFESTDSPRCRESFARGFTLIELLIAIVIIGILAGLLFPVVQAAREMARRSQCGNQLRQFGLGALQHEQAHRHFPTGGWSGRFSGDPDRGFSAKQPGGWAFNILPYVDEQNLRAQGRGLDEDARRRAGAQRDATPVPILICPSRRSARAYPLLMTGEFANINRPTAAARTDYAANAGDTYVMSGGERGDFSASFSGTGPATYAEADAPDCAWPFAACTGVIFQRSEVPVADIRDGLSNTYLIGERYLNPDDYTTGRALEDDQTAFVGHDRDVIRFANREQLPQMDRPGSIPPEFGFGSAHAASFNMVFCDGSMRSINYEIDATTHERLGHRKDGRVLDNW